MKLRHSIFTIIASVVLTIGLLLPSVIQFTHIFENHHHTVCTDYTVHLHEKITECPICDFHLSTFSFNPLDNSFVAEVKQNERTETLYFFSAKLIPLQHPDSRGPPLFLIC
ncbi:hypothetical protein ATE92_2237 [Ulvibacter sp. MAR_2010_11]|uniref:hypothetical protein n=1 Tax=Ulvibacter sp. MAR_2010_11 TaxID=1250229 RepID=UPI000C2CD2D9|nr:hypothetical protein [Ulvibacter sp. MAR_2010_11]PKA84067.1 hypothetical protein ATE92_2237 [Ulvibacter sp. MAR_2010_11]